MDSSKGTKLLRSDAEGETWKQAGEAERREHCGTERYRIIEKCGEGGMGEVYRAYDRKQGREVAIKYLKSDDKMYIVRFSREAMAVASLDHPNIVELYEYGQLDGRYYYTMEYVKARPWRVLARELREDFALAAKVFAQVARAVFHANRAGVYHRDIKPGNILVAMGNRGPIARLIDFGLVKIVGMPDLTKSGVLLGTPHYMSPEQAKGDIDIDGRSEVYSLGASLYHVITGRPPYRGAVLEILRQIATSSPAPPREVNPDIPEQLERVCVRAMARQIEGRYRDARALALALEDFYAHSGKKHLQKER